MIQFSIINSKFKIFIFLFIILILGLGFLNIVKAETKCLEYNAKGECINMSFGDDFSVVNTAQKSEGLVSCGPKLDGAGKDWGRPCTFCDLLKTANKVFNFAIFSIAIPLVVVMIIYGGFVIMTAGDSTDKTAQGRKIIQSGIIGVVIVLCAWLIISEILVAITDSNYDGHTFDPIKIFTTGITCS